MMHDILKTYLSTKFTNVEFEDTDKDCAHPLLHSSTHEPRSGHADQTENHKETSKRASPAGLR